MTDVEQKRFYSLPEMAVEGNLLVFPIFLVSSTKGGRKGWFAYKTTTVHNPPNGQPETIEQEWLVNGSHRWGLTRAVDLDICMAITEVAQQRGGMPDDGVVWFSFYELKELLGWSRSGNSYRLIRESLERTAATNITSRKAFWSPRRANYISKTFSLWNSSINYARDYEGRHSERHHVRFDELVVESYQDGYIGRLDPAFFRNLEQSTAKRLYMLCDHHCVSDGEGRPGHWEIAPFDLMELMPLASYDRPGKVEQVLEKGHEELVHSGYLEDVEVERGKRNTPLLFRFKQSPSFARKRLGAEIERDPAGRMALAKLRKEKVNRSVALELINEYGPAYCAKYADLLPLIPNVEPGKGAGYLVKAIRNGYEWEQRVARLPKGRGVASVPGVTVDPEDSHGSAEQQLFPEYLGQGVKAGPDPEPRDRSPDSVDAEGLDTPPPPSSAADIPADTSFQAAEVWSDLIAEYIRSHGSDATIRWANHVRAASFENGVLGIEAVHGAPGAELANSAGEDLLSLLQNQRGGSVSIEVWAATLPGTRIVIDSSGPHRVFRDPAEGGEAD